MEHQRATKSTQKEQPKAPSSLQHQSSLNRVATYPLLHLQRTIGNQAVLNLLRSQNVQINTPAQTFIEPRFSHDFSQIPIHPPAAGSIQTKLAINQPRDHYEQEADRISQHVMQMPEPQLQRACACDGACPKCQMEQPGHGHELLQAKRVQVSDTEQTAVPPMVHEVLRSPGQPLASEVRAFMEPRFGYDFSQVRVHTDSKAADSAGAVNSRAYTVGSDVVFANAQFGPSTSEGRTLLAHELAHVVQQSGGALAIQRVPDPNDDLDAARKDLNAAIAELQHTQDTADEEDDPVAKSRPLPTKLSLLADDPHLGSFKDEKIYEGLIEAKKKELEAKKKELEEYAEAFNNLPMWTIKGGFCSTSYGHHMWRQIQHYYHSNDVPGAYFFTSQLFQDWCFGGYLALDKQFKKEDPREIYKDLQLLTIWLTEEGHERAELIAMAAQALIMHQELGRFGGFSLPTRPEPTTTVPPTRRFLPSPSPSDSSADVELPTTARTTGGTTAKPNIPDPKEPAIMVHEPAPQATPRAPIVVTGEKETTPSASKQYKQASEKRRGGSPEAEPESVVPVKPSLLEKPYVNNNPKATLNEKQVGALLNDKAHAGELPGVTEVEGLPETPGKGRSGDYRFTHPDGSKSRADHYGPKVADPKKIAGQIFEKSGQAETAVIELGAGESGQLGVNEAQKMAKDVVSTPGISINRVIVIKNGAIIVDVSR